MIETRYSIEYVDPNPKTLLSRLSKLLIYSVLTISIAIAILALIISNLPPATSQNIKAKAQGFVNSFYTTKPSMINAENFDETLAQQELSSSKRETALKKEIQNLNQENTILHNQSVKQLANNQKLKEKLTLLSKQLKTEGLKYSQLAEEVVTLNRRNRSVSAQLDEKTQVAKDYANEIKKLEHKKKTTPVVTAPLKTVVIKNEMLSQDSMKKAAPKEDKTKTSQIDAIVAAMKAANNTSSTINTKISKSNDNK